MVELEFKNLSVVISSKPRSSSHSVELSLDALYLKDKITKDSMFPVLGEFPTFYLQKYVENVLSVGPPGLDRTSVIRVRTSNVHSPRVLSLTKLDDAEQQLFRLVYEKKPPHSGCDYR